MISFSRVASRQDEVHLELVQKSTIKIDLNTATVSELMLLPGIGPHLAEAIARRRSSPGFEFFREAEDIEKVSGIGKVKSRGIAPYVIFAGSNHNKKTSTCP